MNDNDKKYHITIRNWDKYQKDIKGARRNWVAISTDLLHDPDIVNLTVEQRWLWVAMLLHAGRVGVEYELSISSARLLFKLRPGWRGVVDFEVLKNQGFIDFRSPTRRTRSTRKTDKCTKAKKNKKTTTRFDDFWATYPKKSAKQNALKVWERDNLDSLADTIIQHVEKRKSGDEQWLNHGGKYIPLPATFLNNQRWEDEWEPIQATVAVKHRKPEVVTEEQRRRDAEKANRELAALMEKRQ